MDKECLMIVKTSQSKVKKAMQLITNEHSYECPAVSAFPIQSAHIEFKKWLEEQTKS